MYDSQITRTTIAFSSLFLLLAGDIATSDENIFWLTAGLLGLTSAYGLDYIARHQLADQHLRAIYDILRENLSLPDF